MEERQSTESLHDPYGEHIRTASKAQTASPLSLSRNGRIKISIEDIEFVHRLIERCLCYYMTKDEVVNTLAHRVHIEPCFTTLVWQSLKEENPEFFSNYYISLIVKEQIDLYNQLVKQQNDLMKRNDLMKEYHSATKSSLHNDLGHLPVNSSIGNSVEQLYHPFLGATDMDSSYYGSSYQMVNGVPAAGDFYPIQQNVVVSSDSQEMATEPSGQLSFEPDEILGLSGQPMTFDAANPSNLGSAEEFQLEMYDGSRISSENISSHANLTTGLTNIKDPAALESYQSSPFPYPDTVGIVADDLDECDIDDYFIVDDPYHEAQNPIYEEKL